MVRGAMEMLLSSDLGSAAMTVHRHKDFTPGSFLLELVYMLECTAPQELEAGRFLPPTPVRLLLNKKGENLAAKYGPDMFRGKCLSHDRKTAAIVIKSLDEMVRALLKYGTGLADQAAEVLVDSALRTMTDELQEEISRMHRLAQHNANVRDEEIEFVQSRMELLERHLRQANLRLDAMRLMVFR